MKIVTQVGIIFSICWISQIIEKLLPFSFPASVIGMILLFILLCVHILKVDHIREKSDFLLENMAFFFIPAGVSIINYFDVLKNWVVQLIVIITQVSIPFSAEQRQLRTPSTPNTAATRNCHGVYFVRISFSPRQPIPISRQS